MQNLDEKEVMRLWECSAESARWLLDLQAKYPHIDLLLSEGIDRPNIHVCPTMESYYLNNPTPRPTAQTIGEIVRKRYGAKFNNV